MGAYGNHLQERVEKITSDQTFVSGPVLKWANESLNFVIDRLRIEPYAFVYHSFERPIRSIRLKCVTFDFPQPKSIEP